MTYEDVCHILVKKKLSEKEKLDLIKDEILKNPEMINTISSIKRFQYTNIVGLSILYAPEVFNFIQKNDLPVDYSLITKNKESLLHLVTRSQYQITLIDKILPNTLEYISDKDSDGITPLLNSIRHFSWNLKENEKSIKKNQYVIEQLLKNNASTDFEKNENHPLRDAISAHDYKTLDLLIKKGFDLNILINNVPLALYRYGIYNGETFRVTNPKKKEEMMQYLISHGYDYKIFNENNSWKVGLLEEANRSKDNLKTVSDILMSQGVDFNLDSKSIIKLFYKIKQNNDYLELIKLFKHINADYTLTDENNVNVLSLMFDSTMNEEKSIAVFDYLLKNDVKINLDIFSLSVNTFDSENIGKSLQRCHFIEMLLHIYEKDQFVEMLSFVEKNIEIKDNKKIKINFDHMDSNIFEDLSNPNELESVLDKLFNKISVTQSSYAAFSYDGNRPKPFSEMFIERNEDVKSAYVSNLFSHLWKKVSDKTHNKEISSAEQILKEVYFNSPFKTYLDKKMKQSETKVFEDLLQVVNEDNKKYHKDNIAWKLGLITLIEQDILNNTLMKDFPVNNVVKKRL